MDAVHKHLRQNIKNNLLNGIAWSIGFNLVTPFIPVLAAQLGATNTNYAMLASVPALLSILVTLPASFILDRFKHQKRIIAGTIVVSRFCYFALAFIPLLPISPMTALIALVGVYNATNAVIAVAYQSMMGEIIPVSYRNRVFAQRNIWTGLCGMAAALVAGWGIDLFPYPYGYQTAFTLGFIAALVETWYFNRLHIPSEETQETVTAATAAIHTAVAERHPLLQKLSVGVGWPFYLFCTSSIIYTFAWQAAWPIYNKVKAVTLHASNMIISIDGVAGAVGSLLAYRLWARMADRWGNGMAMFISGILLALTPFFWIYAPSMGWVIVYDFIGGFATGGFTQSIFNRLLEIVPAANRQRAIALYTTLSQVSAIFAPIAGMKLYSSVDYTSCMAIIGAARVFGALTFLVILLPLPYWLKRRRYKPSAETLTKQKTGSL
jgi:MFS family permease